MKKKKKKKKKKIKKKKKEKKIKKKKVDIIPTVIHSLFQILFTRIFLGIYLFHPLTLY